MTHAPVAAVRNTKSVTAPDARLLPYNALGWIRALHPHEERAGVDGAKGIPPAARAVRGRHKQKPGPEPYARGSGALEGDAPGGGALRLAAQAEHFLFSLANA